MREGYSEGGYMRRTLMVATRASSLLIAALCVLSLSGCGTVSAISQRPVPYGGVQLDFLYVPDGGPLGVLLFMDMLPSALADTVLLPVTIPYALATDNASFWKGHLP
jgi:uncharacterized protein YceK